MQIIKNYIIKKRYFFLFFLVSTIFGLTLLVSWPIIDSLSNCKFETIIDLKKYADFYPEDYKIENNDWTDPSFTNLYKTKLSHSILDKTIVALKIKRDPIFGIQKFQNLLENISESRINQKLESPFDKTVELKENDKCIIFGDLHASFHSLTRDLIELEKQKIIDNNLKILPKNTYIIILGDAINRAPYSLEVLNVLLLLMEKNPENVIYLRGNHEKNGYWRNFNTRRQIQTIFPKFANLHKKDNLFDKIDVFFNTLPDALIIKIENKESSTIILSNSEKPKLFENKKDVKFMIIGEKRFDVLKETHGLEFVGYESGVAKWSIISCQSAVYNKYFKFHSDAFLELLIGHSANNCILTLNNRDVREKRPEYKQTHYDPIFGHKLKDKSQFMSRDIIKIGSTMSLSGITAPMSNENKIGLETAFFVNNKNSELFTSDLFTSKLFTKKNLILPIILDDGYSPRVAKSNINKIINTYGLNTIVAPTGTGPLAFYLDMVKAGKVFVFFPNTGAEIFRNKDIKNIINFRASYTDETKTTIGYLTKVLGIKSFAFFYQNDAYGKPISEVAHNELKNAGINTWTDIPHLKTQSEFKSSTEKLKTIMPEAIGCFSANATTQQLIEELGPDFFSGRILFGVSFLFSDAFKKFLDDRGIKYILTGVVPDPEKSELEIAKEFRKEMNLKNLNSSLNALEGYISGSLIANAINNMMPPFTAEKIMNYFENMNNYKFKGLNLIFNPEKRNLSQPVWLRTLDLKWINYKN